MDTCLPLVDAKVDRNVVKTIDCFSVSQIDSRKRNAVVVAARGNRSAVAKPQGSPRVGLLRKQATHPGRPLGQERGRRQIENAPPLVDAPPITSRPNDNSSGNSCCARPVGVYLNLDQRVGNNIRHWSFSPAAKRTTWDAQQRALTPTPKLFPNRSYSSLSKENRNDVFRQIFWF